MGYYIEVPNDTQKAEQLIKLGAKAIPTPKSFYEVPAGKVLICVVRNSMFDAAGIVYDKIEFEDFSSPSDGRPKTWLLMDQKTVLELAPHADQVL